MRNLSLIFCFIFLQVTVTAQKKFVVDADAILRTVNERYDAIKVSGGIDLYLSQADDMAVAVSASTEAVRNNIKTSVENGLLHIYYDGDKFLNNKNKKLRAYVSFDEIKKIEAIGACDVFVVDSLLANNLTLHLSGASEFKGIVKVTGLNLILSGASDVYITGTAGTVNIESSGASDVHGYGLVTDYCNTKASGASDIQITVNKEINAKASGASNIFYKGDALLKQNESSNASTIEKRKGKK